MPEPTTIREVDRELREGHTELLIKWIEDKRHLGFFLDKCIPYYNYEIRYMIISNILPINIKKFKCSHPGFPSLPNLTINEWTLIEIINRCKISSRRTRQLFLDSMEDYYEPYPIDVQEDEHWAMKIIAEYQYYDFFEIDKETTWKNILDSFDGTSRWVRCVAAFLNSISNTSFRRTRQQDYLIKDFHSINIKHGWDQWMTPSKKIDFIKTTIKYFHNSPSDCIMQILNYTPDYPRYITHHIAGNCVCFGLLSICLGFCGREINEKFLVERGRKNIFYKHKEDYTLYVDFTLMIDDDDISAEDEFYLDVD
jgi:hypothetical protein